MKVSLYDPLTLGILPPVPLADDANSPLDVSLAKSRPSDQAEVRLLFWAEVVQKERTGHSIFSSADEEGDGAGPGGWHVRAPLGGGGQASVYLAEREGQIGALKVARDDVTDPIRLNRLRREIGFARLATRLPFFARVLDSSADGDSTPYLVTELASLGSAEDHLQTFKGDAWLVLRMARNVATALEALHGLNVVHRDIKPKNLLLYSLDRVGVADLGVAYDIGQTSITRVDDKVNSGFFSPPECEDGGRPTAAFDVFMLGRTIYYLLTGEKPARGDFTSPELSVGRFVGERASAALNPLLRQLLEVQREARPQSMSEVVRGIDDAIASLSGVVAGRCTGCGKSSYRPVGNLTLTKAYLGVPIPGTSGQEFLGNGSLMLAVCPLCGGCALTLAEPQRRALMGAPRS